MALLDHSWILPAAFAVALGFWRIGRAEVWQDELVTIDVASRSTGQIIHLVANVDGVHAAYYLLIHVWIGLFGDSPTAIRAPSALAMAGAAGCVALVGERLFDRWVGFLSGMLFVVIPAISRFAQEARSYAFVVFTVALAAVLFLRAVDHPTAGRWICYSLSLTAIIYFNVIALTIIVGHAVGLVFLRRRAHSGKSLVGFGIAVVAAALSGLPVVYLGLAQASRQVAWIARTAPWRVWPEVFASAWLGWAVLALGALAWFRRSRLPVAFVTVVALCPLVAVWLASLGQLNYFFSKYLLFVLPACAVLAGAGLTAIRPKIFALVTLVVALVLAEPGQRAMRSRLAHSWYTYPEARVSTPLAYSDAAKIIAKDYLPGDGIAYLRSPVWWFMTDAGVRYYLPPKVKLRDVFLGQTAADANDIHAADCSDSTVCIGDEKRLWLVLPYLTSTAIPWFDDDQQDTLSAHYKQVWVTHVSGMTVALLMRTD